MSQSSDDDVDDDSGKETNDDEGLNDFVTVVILYNWYMDQLLIQIVSVICFTYYVFGVRSQSVFYVTFYLFNLKDAINWIHHWKNPLKSCLVLVISEV